tara:strand:+ start:886 stop:1044 length:159 start_codon:yes stop_codon:yes gene_type:complete
MIELKIASKNDHWFTKFNGTLKEAEGYYLHKTFNVDFPERLEYVISVELINN